MPRFFAPISLLATLVSITMAAPPDLTNGGVPGDTISFNMGPTGARGWVYHVKENSSESRQIQIKSVASGSPAAGILAADDVILGASGNGAEPVNFSTDARRALADAINDAEALTPAVLKLIRWRAELTETVTLTLQTMGAYSATAPYNCPKSTLILQQGLQSIMAGETAGNYSFGTLSLIAGNKPSDPNNAARITRAQTEARTLVPIASVRAQMMADTRDATSMITWERGHKLVVMAEYFLLTGDTQVLPGIEAYAVNIAKNCSMFGTMGHIYAEKNIDGSANGPMGGVYGPVNSTGMTCFLGLLLARECGLTNPELTPSIERMNRFFGYYAGRGCVPYGEHEAYWQGHENNGKSGLAALCFNLQNTRADEGKFFAKMATAATTEREIGHTGAFFNYTWSPLGAATGGEAAAASHFSRVRWMLDLNRRWDGKFDYDCLNGEGDHSGDQWYDFRMSTPALLTYALPLRQLRITGKNHNSNRYLAAADVSDAVAVDGYSATARTQSQLITDLSNWSPRVQRRAAEQLATTSIDSTILAQITALANDTNGNSRIGACMTLGKISNSSTANARAATLAALLTDSDNHVRFMAAESMRYLPDSNKLTQLNTILSAAASTATPLLPFDEEDPLHFAHGRLAMLIFYSGTAYGPKGFLWGSKINTPTVIDRALLYPAIRAVAANPIGQARSTLNETYKNLTAADVNALAGTLVESIRYRAPSDKMFSNSIREGGLTALEKYNIAEGVPLSIRYMTDDGRDGSYDFALGILKNYAGGCTTVTPDPEVIAFCQSLLSDMNRSNNWPEANLAIDAINADTNPAPLTPFKSIQSATIDAASINLPANQTVLHVNGSDLAEGNPVYTWRKVRGPGNATFTPNGTAAAKDSTIQINNIPGTYEFEVTMSDSRGLTELYRTIEMTLRNPDGSLPSDNPPVAQPLFVNATPGLATPFTIQGIDPEGFPVVYTVTTQPANGTLSGTAPNLIYTPNISYVGSDQFNFQVTDVDLKTATGTVTFNVTRAGAKLLVHEPFDYTTGGLDGKGGTTDFGLTGVWSASASSNLIATSLTHGSLPVSGGSIGSLATGSKFGGTRSINTTLLAQKGLLDNGATLWFSAVMGYASTASITNARLALAFSNSSFNTGDGQYYINNEGPQLGNGLGVMLARNGTSTTSGRFYATHFRDVSKGTGTTGFLTDPNAKATMAAGSRRLIIGKITWGAASDTIEIYQPLGSSMDIGALHSTITANVDQSTFDTITWTRGDAVTMDEIRFGTSYNAVAGFQETTTDADAPLVSNIEDDRSGASMIVNTPVNYTVTFSEIMDSNSVDATDFGNAGTSSVTIGAISQIAAGVFSVRATATTPGTLKLRVNSGAALKDLAGNPLNTTTAIADGTTLTVSSPTSHFHIWSGGSTAGNDSNGDGVPNAIAWLLGAANPSAPSTALLPAIDNSDPDFLIFNYRRSDAAVASNPTVKAQFGSNITGWTDATPGPDIFITPANDLHGPGIDNIEVKIRRNLATGGRLFVRLKVGPAP